MYLQEVIFHIKYTWIMGQVYFRKNRFINCEPHLLNGSALVRELICIMVTKDPEGLWPAQR